MYGTQQRGVFSRVYRYKMWTVHNEGVCSAGYADIPDTDTRGIFGRRTKLTEVSGTGIEFVPNLTGVFGRVLMPYRTLPKTWVGYLPSKYPGILWYVPYRPHTLASMKVVPSMRPRKNEVSHLRYTSSKSV